MALAYDGAIQRLIDAFANLPGIGPKGAQRIAFYLLNAPDEESQALIDAITEVKEKVRFCDICGNVCETSPCPVCADPRRDHSVICVVEEPKDVMSIERTREYRGMYHVLGGVINPMANVQPSDLNIAKLIERLKDSEVKEVILALNPNVEGEATTSFLSQLLSQTDIKVTRLASGLPVGGDLEYADEITLGRALAGRRRMSSAGMASASRRSRAQLILNRCPATCSACWARLDLIKWMFPIIGFTCRIGQVIR